jgi:TonB family protein
MTKPALLLLFICLLEGGSGKTQQDLCPRHIETPTFPPIARTAHVTGKITLKVTIDADGKVTNVESAADTSVQQTHPLLQKSAAENMQHWTFANPTSSPHSQTIVYDYEFDPSLPAEGGPSYLPEITRVTFDLPDHVTIRTNLRIIDTSQSPRHE